MAPRLTRKDLDEIQASAKCPHENCDCGGLPTLNAPCHPGEGLDVAYEDGIIRIRCHKCKKGVADFAMGQEPGEVVYAS